MHLVKPPSDPFDVLVTCDPIVRRIVQQLRVWSQSTADGLITGESGVGKSLATRVLHMASAEAQSPLLICHASEPPEVAHPWATLEERGGTLVLDGLERWALDQQTAMVHRLEHWPESAGAVRVLGTSRLSMARLRLEARLHPALARRWDDRIVQLPPLRTRPDDLAPLVQVMLRRAGRPSVRFTPDAWRRLSGHGWPDNVRELRQVVDATLARSTEETLEARHLALDPLAPPALEAMGDQPFDAMRREVDTWYLRRLIHQTNGNLSEAARRSGCSRKVLRERLRRHGLYTPPRRGRAPLLSPAHEPGVRAPGGAPLEPASGMVARERTVSPAAWGGRLRAVGSAA